MLGVQAVGLVEDDGEDPGDAAKPRRLWRGEAGEEVADGGAIGVDDFGRGGGGLKGAERVRKRVGEK